MKMNDVISSHFPSISSKQWKQKIQYELKGKDYQKTLVKTTTDGISSLPFYTHSDCSKALFATLPNQQFSTITIEVYSIEQANKQALTAIKKGIKAIYFILFNKEQNSIELFNNIEVPIFVNCYFLNPNYLEQLLGFCSKKNITLLINPLHKLTQTGNWHRNAIYDFKSTNKIIDIQNSCVTINLNLFHNSGASIVQQLAYSLAQLNTYTANINFKKCTQINYIVSVGTDMLTEIAKLRALRILHQSFCESKNNAIPCVIIQHKSKLNLVTLYSELNKEFTHTEYQIGVLGGVNFICSTPERYFYLDESKNEVEQDLILLKNIVELNKTETNIHNLYIEKLTQQLITNAYNIVLTIEKGGGFLNQLKKETIQQKIVANAKKEQLQFETQFSSIFSKIVLPSKKVKAYPFSKSKKRQTLWLPVIEKRLAAKLEKPIWDHYFRT